MKAVVLQLKDKKAAVLFHDGIVRILPDQNYKVGEVLELEQKEIEILEAEARKVSNKSSSGKPGFGSLLKRHASVAAAALLVCVLGTGTGVAAAFYPVTTVEIGSGADITYRVNIFDTVLSVKPAGEEGAEFAAAVEKEVKGKKLGPAVAKTLDLLEEKGTISTEGSEVEMHVDSMFRQESRLETMLNERVEVWNKGHEEVPDGVRLIWEQPERELPDQDGREQAPDIPSSGSEKEIQEMQGNTMPVMGSDRMAPDGDAPDEPSSDGTVSDRAAPDGTALDRMNSDGTALDRIAPDRTVPDGRSPNGIAPDGIAPDGRTPDGTAPDGGEPDGMAPDGMVHVGMAPDGTAPDGFSPDGTAPNGIPSD